MRMGFFVGFYAHFFTHNVNPVIFLHAYSSKKLHRHWTNLTSYQCTTSRFSMCSIEWRKLIADFAAISINKKVSQRFFTLAKNRSPIFWPHKTEFSKLLNINQITFHAISRRHISRSLNSVRFRMLRGNSFFLLWCQLCHCFSSIHLEYERRIQTMPL